MTIERVVELARGLGVNLDVEEDRTEIIVGWMDRLLGGGSPGSGAKVMAALCAYADAVEKRIELVAHENAKGLKKFYRQFGFKNLGLVDDGMHMRRDPKTISEDADYDYGRERKRQRDVSIAPYDFKSSSDLGVKDTAGYGDNAMDDPSNKIEETEQDIVEKLRSMLRKAGISDENLIGGVRLTDAGHQKVAKKLGIEVGEVELLLRSLATRVRDEKDRGAEMMEDLVNPKTAPRFAVEIDYLKNATIRDGSTGKKLFLRGTQAIALQNRLKSADDNEKQTILATYVGQMTEADEPVVSQDDEHRDALQKTGFWGKAGAGCIAIARSTGRVLIAHRSAEVEQPGTWGTWGGAIDSREDPKAAALRELQEETGFNGKVLGIKPLFVFKKDSFVYSNFLILVDDEFEPTLNWESQDAEWCEIGQWPSPLHFGLKALLSDPASIETIKAAASTNESAPRRTIDRPFASDAPGPADLPDHLSKMTPDYVEKLRQQAEDRVRAKRAARKDVAESIMLDEETSFEDELSSNGGSYNFPWRHNGHHGFATARFKGRGANMQVKVVSIRDSNGEMVEGHDLDMQKAVQQQAIDFIGDE